MTYLDSGDHHRVRGLFAKTFTQTHRSTPSVARGDGGPVAQWPHRRKNDLLELVAHPVPSLVICELLGVPTEDRKLFDGWTNEYPLVSPAITRTICRCRRCVS